MDFSLIMPEHMVRENEAGLTHFRAAGATDPNVFRFHYADKMDRPTGTCLSKQPTLKVYEEDGATVRYYGAVTDAMDRVIMRVTCRGKEHDVLLREAVYRDRVGMKAVLDAIGIEHLVARNHGVILHCSYIDSCGKAVLFTAPSQTGKSTQAELWKRHRGVDIINGDRAAVRIAQGMVLAEGIPFSGSSKYCENRSLPLGAIVYLAQAPVTTLRRMRGYEAFARIWEGISVNTWDKKDMELASETVKTIAESVPVFHMPCTPDESAVVALEQELNKLVKL